MDVKMMEDTDLTSDILVYNILRETDDPITKACNLKFIDKSVPAEEDSTIYIANVTLNPQLDTFTMTEYDANVNIFVKTKQTDYLSASRFLRTVLKHIKLVLKKDRRCRQRSIKFAQTTFQYGSTYTLKGVTLMIQMKESEDMSYDLEEDISCIADFRVDTNGKEEDEG